MILKTDVFPINYFKSIWTPIQAFKNRHELKWWQLLIVTIFLNALLIIPVTLNYTKIDTFPLEDFYPNAVNMLTEELIQPLGKAEYENGVMSLDDAFIVENQYGIVAGGLEPETQEKITEEPHALIFEPNQFILIEEGVPLSTVLYTRDFTLENVQSSQEIRKELSRQWFNQNRVLIVLIFSSMIAAFLFVMTFLIVAGAAFLMYLTKKTDFTSITTYKESVNLILNLLSLPTIVALIFSLFYFDIIIMVSIQYMGLVLLMLLTFYQTQFNDRILLEKEIGKKT